MNCIDEIVLFLYCCMHVSSVSSCLILLALCIYRMLVYGTLSLSPRLSQERSRSG